MFLLIRKAEVYSPEYMGKKDIPGLIDQHVHVTGDDGEGITAYCLTGVYEYPSPTITGSVKKDITMISVKLALSDHRSSDARVASLCMKA